MAPWQDCTQPVTPLAGHVLCCCPGARRIAQLLLDAAAEHADAVSTLAPEQPKRRRVVFHLFAGPRRSDGLVAAAHQLFSNSVEVIEVDHREGAEPEDDLSQASLQSDVVQLVRSGVVLATLMGTPCESFTVAHAREPTEAPWRTKAEPEGRSDLPEHASIYLEGQNALVRFTARVFAAALETDSAAILESPAPRDDPNSRAHWLDRSHVAQIWDMPVLIALRRRAQGRLAMVVAPQCFWGPGPHGKTFQKFTAFLATRAAASFLTGPVQSAAALDHWRMTRPTARTPRWLEPTRRPSTWILCARSRRRPRPNGSS